MSSVVKPTHRRADPIYRILTTMAGSLEKNLRADPELQEHAIFGLKITQLPQIRFFPEKTITMIFMNLLAPFIVI